MKKTIQILILGIFSLSLTNCPTEKQDDNTALFALLLSRSSTSASFAVNTVSNLNNQSNNSNIPGSTILISGSGFTTATTVSVGETSATITSVNSNTILVTMPEIESITENQSVDVVVTEGSTRDTKQINYYPTPTLTPNSTNSISRTITLDNDLKSFHWYKFTTTSSGSYIVNIAGYSSSTINLTIYTNATGNFLSIANFRGSNASHLKTSTLTANSTYYVQVRLTSGSSATYNIGTANQAITGAARCNLHGASSVCIDYLFNNSASSTDCGGGTYTAGANCTAAALGTVVGRCSLPSGTNIGTIYYYSNGGSAYSSGTASTNCNGRTNSIFE